MAVDKGRRTESRAGEAPDPGVLYVMTNRNMPGLLKIGKTSRTVEVRARELSSATGVPGKYRVAWKSQPLANISLAEKAAHTALKRYRVDGEHFRADLKQVKSILQTVEADYLNKKWEIRRAQDRQVPIERARVRQERLSSLTAQYDAWVQLPEVGDAFERIPKEGVSGPHDLVRGLVLGIVLSGIVLFVMVGVMMAEVVWWFLAPWVVLIILGDWFERWRLDGKGREKRDLRSRRETIWREVTPPEILSLLQKNETAMTLGPKELRAWLLEAHKSREDTEDQNWVTILAVSHFREKFLPPNEGWDARAEWFDEAQARWDRWLATGATKAADPESLSDT